ncbi:MAG TPA: MFS transporter [Rhizomicrobium sp.]|jgi:GPH family glycoside/pentoside/hexuronide:cation symporter|nr:MFS transporter [Rhizomicrobium sp.]
MSSTGPASQALPRQHSLATLLVFSLAVMPTAAIGVVLFVYLPPYLAGHLGVSLATIGLVWMSVRLIDIFVDPVLGFVMDRTDTRFGRYRAWLAGGVPIFMIASYMLFLAPKGIGGVYLFFWLFVLYLGNSILSLAQSAWSATLATAYNERSRVFGISTAVGVLAAVLTLFIPVFAPLAGMTSDQGVQAMGLTIVALAPVGVWLAVWRTPERVNKATVHRFVARDYWEIVSKPEVIRLFLAQIALTLGPGWMSAMYIFYFHDARGYTQQQSTILLLVYILIGVAGAPLTARLATRIGKHRTLMITTLAFSLALLSIPLVPWGNVWAAVPVMAWCGFMAAGFGLTINAMMADVGDEIRLHQGKERISLLYSVLSFAGKLTAGFAIGLTFPLLAFFGYKAGEGAHNTPAAIHALEWIFITGPIVFVMMGGICVWGWRLDAARHAGIRAQLDARDALADEAPILASVSATPPHIVLAAGTEAN